ncbi:SDR family NAD(P)-dependent oxidoreductase, partial [Streptomyces sp. NPDC079189]|uniref:SDR family NAD(P)-dependent oxidoreductase n=1 Tax=Streptomyces sp. NPDC079189 TaxID=3154514 RepID=UPI00343BEF6F
MTTMAIIGAGPGLGAATARRFGREGFEAALISRDQGRADALAAGLTPEGVTGSGIAADERDPTALPAPLYAATASQGP